MLSYSWASFQELSSDVLGGSATGRITVSDAVGGATNLGNQDKLFPAYVPPCDPQDGHYRELGLNLTIELKTTALIAGDVINLLVVATES